MSKTQKIAPVRMHFEMEKSLKDSPPNYPVGVRFKKRIVILRKQIDWDEKYQPKAGICDLQNSIRIRISYEEHGYDYTQPVQIVTPSITSSKEFEGVGGFQRNLAQEDLCWETTIVDVVEFDTPLIRRIFSFETNHIFSPRVGNTKIDIVKGVEAAITAGEIDRSSDQAIKDFISKAAADFSEKERKNVFSTIRKGYSAFKNMIPLDTKRADNLAKQLKVPYGFDKNNNVDGYGYMAGVQAGGKTRFYDVLEKSLENDGEPVVLTGFIQDPKPTTLKSQRKSWMKYFKKHEELLVSIVAKTMGVSKDTVRAKQKWNPFEFGGFVPQDVTPQGQNQVKKETTLVNSDGRSL
tara:strand:+ start:213 stop:1262 length:1050 start_codon:yes stop_codon:yes gene_type:complete